MAELSRVYTRDATGRARAGRAGRSPLARGSHFFLPRDLVKVFGPLEELARAGPPSPATPAPARARRGRGPRGQLPGSRALLCALRWRSASTSSRSRRSSGTRALSACSGGSARAARRSPTSSCPSRSTRARLRRHASTCPGPSTSCCSASCSTSCFASAPSNASQARAELLQKLAGTLAPGGALIVLEPALKEITRELMRCATCSPRERTRPYVFAPCLRCGPCPMLASERDWCHQELAYALPPPLAPWRSAAGLRFEGLSYASLVLAQRARVSASRGRRRAPLPHRERAPRDARASSSCTAAATPATCASRASTATRARPTRPSPSFSAVTCSR